jgi:hypothetical protein
LKLFLFFGVHNEIKKNVEFVTQKILKKTILFIDTCRDSKGKSIGLYKDPCFKIVHAKFYLLYFIFMYYSDPKVISFDVYSDI